MSDTPEIEAQIPEEPIPEEPTAERPAKDLDGIPYCPQHHCRMKQSSGGKKDSAVAYYSCQVPKCDESGKRIKTRFEAVVPTAPLKCPRCTRGKRPSQIVYCEKSAELSTASYTILVCPRCGWKSNALARPELAAHDLALRERRSVDTVDIGER
jgi:hypothetical protein